MDTRLIITFAILIVATGLLLSDLLRADLVALLVVFALGVAGVLTPQEAFSGFSRSAVITVMAIFIVTEGLQRTGITEQIGGLFLRIAGSRERRLTVIVMLAGAFLSLFMNNIAAASVLLPAVSGAARKGNVHPSRLLMPLAFATILGGMATLLTSANIVVSSLLRDQGLNGYGLLDFAPLGLPIVATGIAYMALWGQHRLPAQSSPERLQAPRSTEGDLVSIYRLNERLFQACVPAGSYLIGKPLVQSTFRESYGLNVVAVERNGHITLSPPPNTIFQQGDILLLAGKPEDFPRRDVEPYLELLPPREWREQDLESPTIVVVEAVLAPRSGLIGQTLRDTHFREKYGMTVLAIWRAGRPLRTGLTDLPLHFGDVLLLQGQRERLSVLRSESDLIVLANGKEKAILAPHKGRLALLIIGATLLFAAVNPTLIGEVMLGGVLMMVLTGLLTMDQAYQAVEWRSVFLIAGMLPMGVALTKTGAASLLADNLVALLGAAGPLALLAGMFALATLLTQAMNGAAVAAVMTPVAIQAARQIGADPRAVAMGLALATSMAFLTPLGHPVNVLVMSAGGYRFRDYFNVGLPLTLLLFVVVILLLPVFWPLMSH
jgi:di/tricarboxylate transporter